MAYVIDTSDYRPSILLRSLTLNDVANLILLLSRATCIPLTSALDHKPATFARARALRSIVNRFEHRLDLKTPASAPTHSLAALRLSRDCRISSRVFVARSALSLSRVPP